LEGRGILNLIEAKEIIDKLFELYPDQEVRLVFPVFDDHENIGNDVRKLGYLAHWESSTYANTELVMKDKRDGYIGLTWDETPPS